MSSSSLHSCESVLLMCNCHVEVNLVKKECVTRRDYIHYEGEGADEGQELLLGATKYSAHIGRELLMSCSFLMAATLQACQSPTGYQGTPVGSTDLQACAQKVKQWRCCAHSVVVGVLARK